MAAVNQAAPVADPVAASVPDLVLDGLRTSFFTREGEVRAVDGLSLRLERGQTLGLVGESGCGKSVTALSIMRLLNPLTARIVGGAIRFRGQDLVALPEPKMRAVRGGRIAMIFQEPMTSLNPALTIGQQIAETVREHRGLPRQEADALTVEMLSRARFASPAKWAREYPFRLSGGMRQRAMIAMALSCQPELLIADEPTTALDVTIQAQILNLLEDLRTSTGSSMIMITHDLGVVAETCQRVVVMYAGRKVEEAPVRALFASPQHPYTQGLMASVPRLNRGRRAYGATRLAEIPGIVPLMRGPMPGCAFAPRCPRADARCREEAPAVHEAAPDHGVACWHPGE